MYRRWAQIILDVWDPERVKEVLREKGYRMTPQRLAIIETLNEVGRRHPTLKEIYSATKKKVPTMSFSTLYTHIKVFEELGLLALFELNGETRIEVNLKPHINIVWFGKGIVEDYFDHEFSKHVNEIVDKLRISKGIKPRAFIANLIVE